MHATVARLNQRRVLRRRAHAAAMRNAVIIAAVEGRGDAMGVARTREALARAAEEADQHGTEGDRSEERLRSPTRPAGGGGRRRRTR